MRYFSFVGLMKCEMFEVQENYKGNLSGEYAEGCLAEQDLLSDKMDCAR